MVNEIKRPTFGVEDVVKILTMQEKNTALLAGLVDPAKYEGTAGRTRNLMDIG